MPIGRCKWFSVDKGFGFLAVPGESDVFVHVRQLNEVGLDYVLEGQHLTFDVTTNSRNSKQQATNIKLLAPILGSPQRKTDDDAHTAHMELANMAFVQRGDR
jgi:cold shock protein